MLHPADRHAVIRVQGARENNLKNVSVEIPKRRLTVFTGVSGSGKSSLVFATIAAESQRLITQTRLDDSPTDGTETLGRPHPQVEVRIADPKTGETVPVGQVGEILTRGYHVMLGYFDNPTATAEAIDADGWLHTGDLGSMDERGYCRIEGRVKEMIIRGGENIYPREIEQLLFSHPGVADVAVVGAPDDYWGEEVVALVRPAPGQSPTEEELFAFCRQHLAAHKTPRRWVFVDEFPLTPSGKVQKFVLRQRLATASQSLESRTS